MKKHTPKDRVIEISLLQDNWNGEGAVVPSDLVQKNTFKFLDCVLKTGLSWMIKPEDIVPTPYGTIELDFESEMGLVSVEVGKDKIGFFTEFNDGDDFLSEGIPTDFRTIPSRLQEALCRL